MLTLPASLAAIARPNSNQGIELSNRIGVYSGSRHSRGRGRPAHDVYSEDTRRYVRRLEKGTYHPEWFKTSPKFLPWQRQMLLFRHTWNRAAHRKYDISSLATITRVPIPSVYMRQSGMQLWTVARAAELGWILTRNWLTLPEYYFSTKRNNSVNFTEEVLYFWYFLVHDIERNSANRRGPMPNVEVVFKHALSTLVAKRMISNGRWDHLFIPTPTHVAQAWYLIFGEMDSIHNIKKRQSQLAGYCRRFADAFSANPDFQSLYFGHMGKVIEKTLLKKAKPT